ncbi:alpha/beta-hydrolase [Tothia fuscella]|uniref:cutinase n=1 Tax=Tothia fuscella TaxID=1048955 RepID=A0A9P4U339_9PEZI|nr:alpha/beta-hydrolase [Tothia fuscella]
MIGLNNLLRPLTTLVGSTETGNFTADCAPNILIFAKGTFEPGIYGILVGPSFTSGLPAGWTTAGVAYDVDIPGDFCLGLPGGMVAKDIINQAAKKCPASNLFVSGYSQGAMAIRNGLARADESARARVKGVVTFGDPFNGSPIKGYKGPISIFCNTGDGVCTGNFELRPAHLSYGFDTSAGLAQKELFKMAAGNGDQSCCNPPAPPKLPTPEQWAQTVKANGGKVPTPNAGTSIADWGNAIAESNGAIPKFAASEVKGTPKSGAPDVKGTLKSSASGAKGNPKSTTSGAKGTVVGSKMVK